MGPGNAVPASNVRVNNHHGSSIFCWRLVFGFTSWGTAGSASLGSFHKEAERKDQSKDTEMEPQAGVHEVQATHLLHAFSFSFQFWVFLKIPLNLIGRMWNKNLKRRKKKKHFHKFSQPTDKNYILLNKLEIIQFCQGSSRATLSNGKITWAMYVI